MSPPLPTGELMPDVMTMNPVLGALLAAFDSFWVIMAIAIGSAVFNWWQKRKQAAADQEAQSPVEPHETRQSQTRTQPPAPRPAKSVSWEEELRRLLEGDAPVAPPPLIIEKQPAPVPPPIRVRPVAEQPPPAPARPLVTLAASSAAYLRAEQLDKQVEAQLGRVGSLVEAAAAFQKASGLDVAASERTSKVTGHHFAHAAVVQHKAVSADVAQVVALFRNPRLARQAVLASLILGPPKALET